MLFFLHLIIFAVVGATAPTTAPTAAPPIPFSKLFQVDSSCAAAKRDLDSVLIETLDMISTAISALDVLLDKSSYSWFSKQPPNIVNLMDAANTAWGFTIPEKTLGFKISSPSASDLAVLTTAKGNRHPLAPKRLIADRH